MDTAIVLQLHLEDLEDRSRRNDLQLWGLSEATGVEHLQDTVKDIFHKILDSSPLTPLELDSVHRSLGPKPSDPGRPCNVICRILHYTQKELIFRKAWKLGAVDFDGSLENHPPMQGHALPDFGPRRTIGDYISMGLPLGVHLPRGGRHPLLFAFCMLADLLPLCCFLETDPIQVPNWLIILPHPGGRSGVAVNRGNWPAPSAEDKEKIPRAIRRRDT